MRLFLRRTLPIAVLATLAAATWFGPPRITVREVVGTPPTPGAVLELRTEHHTDEEKPEVTGRAIGMQAGSRIAVALTIAESRTKGLYGVTPQWEKGSPWVLVFTVRQGPNGSHGSAESLVKVNAAGSIVGIETPGGENARGDRSPRALRPAEIEAAFKSVLGTP